MTVTLKGARVLLTGATGGLGQEIARHLKGLGCELILSGRQPGPLKALAEELSAEFHVADLSSMASVAGLIEAAGRVDVLIANAALPGTGELLEYTSEQIDAHIGVNLRTPIVMTHELLPQMLARGSGQIVIIGSVAGITASPGSSLYNATKFGVRGFAAALRQDLHGTGVGVSLIAPGFVRDAGMAVNGGLIDQLPSAVRTVSPQQVAKAVAKAIRKDKGQIVVAPLELRAGATLGSVAPEIGALVQRASGAAELTKSQPE